MARYIGPTCKLARREGADLGPQERRRARSTPSASSSRSPASTAPPAPQAASCPTTPPSCARSRRSSACTACWSASSATTTRRPRPRRATPARTCCSCWRPASTTSSTAWASRSPAPAARQLVVAPRRHRQRQVGQPAVVPGQGRRRDRAVRDARRSSCACRKPLTVVAADGSVAVVDRSRCQEVRWRLQVGAGPCGSAVGHQRSADRRVVLEVSCTRCRSMVVADCRRRPQENYNMTVTANQVLRPRGPRSSASAGNRAKVVIEPLERGYGHTLGNALRRVLLSSIPGFAITEVEIDGVLHEYTTHRRPAGGRARGPAQPQGRRHPHAAPATARR